MRANIEKYHQKDRQPSCMVLSRRSACFSEPLGGTPLDHFGLPLGHPWSDFVDSKTMFPCMPGALLAKGGGFKKQPEDIRIKQEIHAKNEKLIKKQSQK